MLPPNGQYRLETSQFDGDASYLFKASGPNSFAEITGNSTLGYQGGELRDIGLTISVQSTPASTRYIRVSLNTCNNGVWDSVCHHGNAPGLSP